MADGSIPWFAIIIVNLSFLLRYTEQKDLISTICGREGNIVFQGKCVPLDDTLFKEIKKSISRNSHNYSMVYRKCGEYSQSKQSDRFHCVCLDGYARAVSQVMNSTAPCYKIQVNDVRVETISHDSIRVRWHVPTVFVGRVSVTVAFREGSVSYGDSHRRTRQKVTFKDFVTFTNITLNKQAVYTINVQVKITEDFKRTFTNSSIFVFKLRNRTEEYHSTSAEEETHPPSLESRLEQHHRDALQLFLTSFLPPVGALVLFLFMTCRLYKSRTRSGGDIARKYHIVKEQQIQNGRHDNDECFVKQIASNFYS